MPRKSSKTAKMRSRKSNATMFHRGRKINLPSHPTEFTAIPWMRATVRINNPTTAITYGQLYTDLLSQYGFTVPSGILNIRLLSVKVWGPIPTTNTRLTVTFRDVFDNVSGTTLAGQQMTLDEVSNYADAVNRARVGYRYSTAQQQKSLIMITGGVDEICALVGAGNGSVAYIDCLWRPFRTTPTPAVDQDEALAELVDKIKTHSDFVCDDGFYHTGIPPCCHECLRIASKET